MGISKIKTIRLSTYDKKWSKMARAKRTSCERCGKTEYLAAHHFVRRSVKPTRLFLPNAVILCPSCHTFNHLFSAHRTPEIFKTWFKDKFPLRYKKIMDRERLHMTERDAIKEFKEKYEFPNT